MSLRFRGDDLQPDEVSQALGCRPDRAAPKDGALSTPRGNAYPARSGTWIKRVAPRSPGDLDGQIVELLALATDDLDVWNRLSAEFDGDLFCGVFLGDLTGGIELDPRTLLAIGARGLELGLDVYGTGGQEVEISGS